MSIGKFLIILGIYFLSMLVFHFIANIVCNLADLDTDLLILLSFIWPASLAGVFILLIFSGINLVSDKVCDKIEDYMYKREQKKSSKDNK